MNCVAPHASERRNNTGSEKKRRHVAQNGALRATAGVLPAVEAASNRPRSGSGTNTQTISAATTPTTPSARKALRQLYAAATDAPKATPSACPIGGPKLKMPSAAPRAPGGK